MSRRDPIVIFRQMLDLAREAVSFAKGSSREDFKANRVLQLALVRLIEVIGEAANRMPVEQRPSYPNIDWQNIIGMRNRLIHGYDILNLDIVWDTVEDDLPPLIRELERLLETEA
ncbi:MAG: DUF86 domain-containing protein [Chloroflexi bacterium]|nr:DUF86 domain-containing protein [Chloroflexota bacterium]